MEEKSFLKELKSLYIYQRIFNFIGIENLEIKLFIHSKYFQKKLKLTLYDYQKAYLNKIVKNITDYLSSDDSLFDKDYLNIKFKNDIMNYNITKSIFQNYLDDIFKNLNEKENFKIDIFSPFFEFLCQKEYFEKLFTIRVNLIKYENLVKEYKIIFNKLNEYKYEYSSIDFIIDDNTDINSWKNYNIDFNKIKKLNIFEIDKDIRKKYITNAAGFNDKNFKKLIINFLNCKYFQNNLNHLRIDINFHYPSIQFSLNDFNNFINLEKLILNKIVFSKSYDHFLALNNLKELELIQCKNIFFDENSCMNLKKISLKQSSNINSPFLLKFPKLEICELNIHTDKSKENDYLNISFIDFSSCKNLKIFEGSDNEFLQIKNLYDLNLEKIKLYSNFKKAKTIINIINKLLNPKLKNTYTYFIINKTNLKNLNNILPDLFIEYQKKDKIENLLNFLLNIIFVNDEYTYDKFITIIGYPSLVVKPISSDKNQNWPLFGESLINGNINEEIYEYLTTNHREKNMCLLEILFPSKYNNIETNDNKKFNRVKKIKISEEYKKIILTKIINECFGENNNYALFKYIYLMPSRSLLYHNLYEEIKLYSNKEINFDKFKAKEQKFIKHIEQEISHTIKILKNNNEQNGINNKINTEFKCYDEQIKNFLGFNSDIIPGQIIKEEIRLLVKSNNCALYRIDYFTKYFNTDILRKSLLHNDDGDAALKENKNILDTNNEIDKCEKNIDIEVNKEEVIIYDILEKNENNFIKDISNNKFILLNNNAIKDKNDIKKTLARYIFLNKANQDKAFNSNIKKMKKLIELNNFIPDFICDIVGKNNYQNFYNINRIRSDLPFVEFDNITVNIYFDYLEDS